MTASDDDKFVREIRSALQATLARNEFDADDVLRALSDISRQIKNAALVRAVVAKAGFQAVNCQSNGDLEVYFDIQHGASESGYLAKGGMIPDFEWLK